MNIKQIEFKDAIYSCENIYCGGLKIGEFNPSTVKNSKRYHLQLNLIGIKNSIYVDSKEEAINTIEKAILVSVSKLIEIDGLKEVI